MIKHLMPEISIPFSTRTDCSWCGRRPASDSIRKAMDGDLDERAHALIMP